MPEPPAVSPSLRTKVRVSPIKGETEKENPLFARAAGVLPLSGSPFARAISPTRGEKQTGNAVDRGNVLSREVSVGSDCGGYGWMWQGTETVWNPR